MGWSGPTSVERPGPLHVRIESLIDHSDSASPSPAVPRNHPTGHAGCCRYFPRGGGDSASASGSGLPFVSGKKGTAISPRI